MLKKFLYSVLQKILGLKFKSLVLGSVSLGVIFITFFIVNPRSIACECNSGFCFTQAKGGDCPSVSSDTVNVIEWVRYTCGETCVVIEGETQCWNDCEGTDFCSYCLSKACEGCVCDAMWRGLCNQCPTGGYGSSCRYKSSCIESCGSDPAGGGGGGGSSCTDVGPGPYQCNPLNDDGSTRYGVVRNVWGDTSKYSRTSDRENPSTSDEVSSIRYTGYPQGICLGGSIQEWSGYVDIPGGYAPPVKTGGYEDLNLLKQVGGGSKRPPGYSLLGSLAGANMF